MEGFHTDTNSISAAVLQLQTTDVQITAAAALFLADAVGYSDSSFFLKALVPSHFGPGCVK